MSGGGIEFVSGIIKINTIIEVVIVTAVIMNYYNEIILLWRQPGLINVKIWRK